MEKIYNENSYKSGTYKIINKINGRKYFGSAKNFKKRWKNHEYLLKNNKHENKFLQRDFNLCGTDAFIFEVIEVIEGEKQLRLDAEQFLLNEYWDNKVMCYNLCKLAQSPQGRPFSHTPEETKRKRSEAMKGRKLSPETIEKIRILNTGKKRSEKTKQKISEAGKGRPAWNKGKTYEEMYGIEKALILKKNHSKKLKGKQSWMKGRKHTKEAKLKQSIAKKGKYIGNKHPMFGKTHSPESIKLMSEARKGKPSPNKGRKLGTGMKCKNSKIYINLQLLSKDGILFDKIEGLTEFCRIHDLNPSALCALLKGKSKSHKGWKIIN